MISLVVMVYVTYGGLRGTAWANTFQTLVFMGLGAVTFVYVSQAMGGFGAGAGATVGGPPRTARARRQLHRPMKYLTYSFIPLSAGMPSPTCSCTG